MKIALIICVIILCYGTLLIIDAIQKDIRESKSVAYEMSEDDGSITYIDTTGLTDDEVQSLLEQERNERLNK
jgi:hypothetical protein